MKDLLKNFLVTAGGVLVSGAILLMGFGTSLQEQSVGGYLQATPIGVATTSTSVAVTSSARVLATTTSTTGTSYTRLHATICNPSSTLVYLNLDGDKPAALGASTYIIAAAAGYDACYTINEQNSYQGSVTASSTNETSTTVYVKDYVQ